MEDRTAIQDVYREDVAHCCGCRRPTPPGPELQVRGRVVGRSSPKVVVEETVSAGGRVTATGRVVAVWPPEEELR